VDTIRDFKVTERNIDESIIRQFKMWCKLFEKEHKEEIKYLLEYKIELTETITYYSAKE